MPEEDRDLLCETASCNRVLLVYRIPVSIGVIFGRALHGVSLCRASVKNVLVSFSLMC